MGNRIIVCVILAFCLFGFIQQKKSNGYVELEGFSIVFPPSFSTPQKDSTFMDTYYGSGQLFSYVAQNKTGALTAGVQKYGDAAFLGVEDGTVLDSIQQQMLRVMSGKAYRQYKVKRNGLLTRITYFNAKAVDSTPTYWRFELILDKPNIYQLAYTSTDKNKLNAKEVNTFFKSFSPRKKK